MMWRMRPAVCHKSRARWPIDHGCSARDPELLASLTVLGQAFGPFSRRDPISSGSVTDAPGSSPDGSLDGVSPPYARTWLNTMGFAATLGASILGRADAPLPAGRPARPVRTANFDSE